MFLVTKQHTVGPLAGLFTTETTSVRFVAGKTYRTSYGTEYVVTAVAAA